MDTRPTEDTATLIVTTSWDDGHVHDIRLAKLLRKYRIAATFYPAPHNREFAADELLDASQIAELATDFEIGAHTMTHPRLSKVSLEEATTEIARSKAELELITGTAVTSFCYPGGDYNSHIKQAVRAAGFAYARTTERFWTTTVRGAYDAPSTVHAYRHWSDVTAIARFAGIRPFRFIRYLLNWDELAIALFDAARKEPKTDSIFHLWGHSWEIDRSGDWDRLERVLKHIDEHRSEVRFKTNKECAPLYDPRPRILFASSYFPPHGGGLENYVGTMSSRLAGSGGWSVHAAASTVGQPTIDSRPAVTGAGVATTFLKPTFSVSNTPIGLSWPRRLKRLMRTLKPDVVNVHTPVPGLADMAGFQAVKLGIPLAVTYHSGSMVKGKRHIDWAIRLYERLLLPRLLGQADRLIASSEFVRDGFLAAYRSKSVVITPGVDINFFNPGGQHAAGKPQKQGTSASRHTAPPLKQPRALFVGDYSKAANYKRLGDLLQAASVISPHPHVEIVGDSDIAPLYADMAAFLGLESVNFRGVLKGADLLEAYRSANVLVLPSVSESYPTVIAEALACGVPVVAYDTGGVKEMVGNGINGYVVGQKDVYGLGKSMLKIFNNPKLSRRLSTAARQWAVYNASWDGKIAATQAAFQELISAGPSAVSPMAAALPTAGSQTSLAEPAGESEVFNA